MNRPFICQIYFRYTNTWLQYLPISLGILQRYSSLFPKMDVVLFRQCSCLASGSCSFSSRMLRIIATCISFYSSCYCPHRLLSQELYKQDSGVVLIVALTTCFVYMGRQIWINILVRLCLGYAMVRHYRHPIFLI